MSNTTVTVLFFAAARDVTQVASWECPYREGDTVADLRARVLDAFDSLRPWSRALRIAVDGEYAREDALVRAGAELAMIPPVAGG
ncbi:MAG: MoaD/ThiS family protein [Deltaproteobacteria bacterium]|nr:MoaD/ThiS family protein [Deltaproteobacteria bacterium]